MHNISRFIIFVIFAMLSISAFSQGKAIVDYKSKQMRVVKMGDSTVIKMVGEVVFYHNGAVITCDSAYKYSENKMDGMGNVVINQDSVYIYGDKFTYNGDTDIASVYAPIIKTVDNDAILYTRNMEFNTKSKVGTYYDGGTMVQNDNLMESNKGEYYTDQRELVLHGHVTMRNDNYLISTDSVSYNLNTEVVTFFMKTNIWNHKGEFLSAEEGTYNKATEVYNFTKKAYVLTSEQELWSELLTYFSKSEEAFLRQDIQMLDTTQKVMAFGDKGQYWGQQKRVLLTENPSVLSYDPEQADTVYTSADTILVYPSLQYIHKDSIANDSLSNIDNIEVDSLGNMTISRLEPDSLTIDSLTQHTDSVVVELAKEEILADTLTEKLRKKLEKIERRQEKRRLRVQRFFELEGGHALDTMPKADSIALDTIPLKDLSADVVSEAKAKSDSSDYTINAYFNVRIFRADVQAVCDSLVVISADSTMHMYNAPILWNGANQITAEKITLFSKDGALQRAELDNFPIMAQCVDSLKNQFNQVRGKFMEGFFKDNSLYELDVNGNAEALYYKRQEETEIVEGLMKTSSASMEIYFKDNAITLLKWFGSPQTATYPLNLVPPTIELRLEGFSWHENLRPKSKEEIFNRTIIPSYRTEVEAITKPEFEITAGIDAEKERLSKEGLWRDRDELITIDKDSLRNDDL